MLGSLEEGQGKGEDGEVRPVDAVEGSVVEEGDGETGKRCAHLLV